MPDDDTARTPRLVCCGLTTLDVVQVVDAVPTADQKVVARDLQVSFGGPAANAAATAVALGVPSVLVTALGEGPVARLVRDGLRAAGVEVVDLLAGQPGDPALSTVLVTAGTGQRAVVSPNATGRADDLGPATRAATAVLDAATALLVDGHHLAAALELAGAARRRGLPVLLDGGSWKPGLGPLLEDVDVAVLSADFAVPARPGSGGEVAGRETGSRPGATAPDVLAAVAAYGPRVVARSAGAGPVRVRVHRAAERTQVEQHDELLVVPPLLLPDDVVDTLGAGDVLHGAIGAGLARGLDPVAALRAAVPVATESCRHPGALGWVATRSTR